MLRVTEECSTYREGCGTIVCVRPAGAREGGVRGDETGHRCGHADRGRQRGDALRDLAQGEEARVGVGSGLPHPVRQGIAFGTSWR